MPDQVQLRGGSSADNDNFTGAQREVTVDTTNKTLRVHDGVTAGGHQLVQGTASTSSDADTIIQRDEWGRAQVADPVNATDVANKQWVEGQIGGSVAMEPLGEPVIVGAAGASSIEWDAITQDFDHLRVVFVGRSNRDSTSADATIVRLNGDDGTNYDRILTRATGTSTTTATSNGSNNLFGSSTSIPSALNPANLASQQTFDFYDYSRTAWEKRGSARSGFKNGTGASNVIMEHVEGYWRNTAAITRITLSVAVGTGFVENTYAQLYGIRGGTV